MNSDSDSEALDLDSDSDSDSEASDLDLDSDSDSEASDLDLESDSDSDSEASDLDLDSDSDSEASDLDSDSDTMQSYTFLRLFIEVYFKKWTYMFEHPRKCTLCAFYRSETNNIHFYTTLN